MQKSDSGVVYPDPALSKVNTYQHETIGQIHIRTGSRLTRVKDLETSLVNLASFPDFHHRSYIPAPIAIIRRTPYGDQTLVKHILETFLD